MSRRLIQPASIISRIPIWSGFGRDKLLHHISINIKLPPLQGEENSFQLLDLFDKLDVSMLSGTRILVGYGTSDQEMLAAGRYDVKYGLP